MDLYYQNETLYIEILEDLTELEYNRLQKKIFKIIDDYGVDKIVIRNISQMHHNKQFLRQMKQNFYEKYQGDFYIR